MEIAFHSQNHYTAAVCQIFLLNCLVITRARFAIVQKKCIANETLKDNRGKHDNHFVVLADEIKNLIHVHLNYR